MRLFKVIGLSLIILIVPASIVIGLLGLMVAFPKVAAVLVIGATATLCLFGSYCIADDFLKNRGK